MKIGIFAKTFSGHRPKTVLTKAAKAGYQSVAYNMVCSGLDSMPSEVSRSVVLEIKSAVVETGVEISSISATYNMIHSSAQMRNKGLQGLKTLAKLAVQLDSRLLTLCTGTRCQTNQWQWHEDNDTDEAWSDLLTEMRKAILIAEKYDVYLGIEPELANVVNSAQKAKRLIDELQTDRIRVIFDPANLFDVVDLDEQYKILDNALVLLSPYIAQVHAKDRDNKGNFATVGNGVVDYEHYLNALKLYKYEGDIVAHGFGESEAKDVYKFLDASIACQ